MTDHDTTSHPTDDTDEIHVDPEPLEADLEDVLDVFPDGDEVHTPPSEADAPAPG